MCQDHHTPDLSRDALLDRVEVPAQISATVPAFWGSYRSDDLCATAACEPCPYRHSALVLENSLGRVDRLGVLGAVSDRDERIRLLSRASSDMTSRSLSTPPQSDVVRGRSRNVQTPAMARAHAVLAVPSIDAPRQKERPRIVAVEAELFGCRLVDDHRHEAICSGERAKWNISPPTLQR